MDRIESYTPEKQPIAGVLAGDAWTEMVPKTNGQPGNWRNTVADVFQMSPDGSTIYLQNRMVLNFAVERDGITSLLPETIEGLDVDENAEVLSLDALKVLRRDGIINRQGGSTTSAAIEGEPSTGVFEEATEATPSEA
jgi:hypothetical protein